MEAAAEDRRRRDRERLERDTDAQREEATAEARETLERVHSAAVLKEVLEKAKGETLIETNMFDGQRYMGDKEDPDRSVTRIPRDVITAELKKSTDWHDNPDEVIAFTDLIEPRAGLVRFRYQFSVTGGTEDHLYSTYGPDKSLEMRFTEGHGSRKGHLQVAVDLPESMTDKLQKLVLGDPNAKPPIPPNPRIVRTLVKELLLKNNDRSVPEDKLEDERYYPKWDKLPPDWTITMITGDENALGIIDPSYKAEYLALAA